MRHIALMLIVLLTGPTGVFAQAPQVAQGDVWSVVQDLPTGTRLKLTLSDGAEVTGTVVDIRTDAVVMDEIKTTAKTIKGSIRSAASSDDLVFRRTDVTMAMVVQMATQYSAGGKPPNSGAVRHLIAAAGVGQKVDVKTSDAKKLRATSPCVLAP
jgi:hypothetical protein